MPIHRAPSRAISPVNERTYTSPSGPSANDDICKSVSAIRACSTTRPPSYRSAHIRPVTEISVQIRPDERGNAAAPINVPARHRASPVTTVLCHRKFQFIAVAAVAAEARRSLHDIPTVVHARLDDVDLLQLVLTGRPPPKAPPSPCRTRTSTGCRSPYAHISGRAPSTPTKGLSSGTAYEPFSSSAPTSIRRIVPSRRPKILAVPPRIAAAPTVADSDVQIPVRPERDMPAVVIRERLPYLHDDLLGGSIDVLRTRPRLIPGDDGSPRRCGGVVDVEIPVVLVIGVEREAEQSLLVPAVAHPAANVEKGFGR